MIKNVYFWEKNLDKVVSIMLCFKFLHKHLCGLVCKFYTRIRLNTGKSYIIINLHVSSENKNLNSLYFCVLGSCRFNIYITV